MALGLIDAEERAAFVRASEKLVNDFIGSLPSLTIVSSLILGATHMHSVGRPVPWKADPTEFQAEHGEAAATTLLWVTYLTNVTAEAIAILVISSACWYRLVITMYRLVITM